MGLRHLRPLEGGAGRDATSSEARNRTHDRARSRRYRTPRGNRRGDLRGRGQRPGCSAGVIGRRPSVAGCEGGGFTLVGLADGTTVSGDQDTTVAAGRLGQTFLARGRYHEFVVVSSTFGVRNQAFTGAPNPLDLTGGRRTVIYAEKTPDHRGLVAVVRREERARARHRALPRRRRLVVRRGAGDPQHPAGRHHRVPLV